MAQKIQCPRCDTFVLLGHRIPAKGTTLPCPGCGTHLWVEPNRPRQRQRDAVAWEEPGGHELPVVPVGWIMAVVMALLALFAIALVWAWTASLGTNAPEDFAESGQGMAPTRPALPARPQPDDQEPRPAPVRPSGRHPIDEYERLADGATVEEVIARLGPPTDEFDADQIDQYYGGPQLTSPSTRLLAWSDQRTYTVLAVFVQNRLHGKALAAFGPNLRRVNHSNLTGRDRPDAVLDPEPPDEMLANLRRLKSRR